MYSFCNAARIISPGGTFKQIPYDEFKVSPSKKIEGASKFLVITSVAIIAIAGLALLSTPLGTTAFYILSGELAFGVVMFVTTVIPYFSLCYHLKTLPLPKAKTVEEYSQLLDLDQENKYSYVINDLLENHKKLTTCDLKAQCKADFGRMTYQFDGNFLPIDTERVVGEIKKVLGDDSTLKEELIFSLESEKDPFRFSKNVGKKVTSQEKKNAIERVHMQCQEEVIQKQVSDLPEHIQPLLNQALFADICSVLQGRYSNEELNIYVLAAANLPYATSLINVVNSSNRWFVILSQSFQFLVNSEYKPWYIKAELVIDVDARTGKLTWKSPQTTKPTLI